MRLDLTKKVKRVCSCHSITRGKFARNQLHMHRQFSISAFKPSADRKKLGRLSQLDWTRFEYFEKKNFFSIHRIRREEEAIKNEKYSKFFTVNKTNEKTKHKNMKLKAVSAIFLLVVLSPNVSTCETWKNYFYFTSKALSVREKIKF